MNQSALSLPVRHYRALPIDNPDHEHEVFDLQIDRTALIGMHCWNIGCPDGPDIDVNYCVGMGWPQSTEEAFRIMVETIRPTMDAARAIGMPVCHVETDWMDTRYPQIPSRRVPNSGSTLLPQHQAMLDRAHGRAYLAQSPLADMQRAEIVAPVNDEPLIFYTDVLDEYLKARDIDTLIYTGFATDMCILGAEGGGRPMLARGYRCILMRDATVGVETPQSFPERLATRYGIHLFEWTVGYSTTSVEFLEETDKWADGQMGK